MNHTSIPKEVEIQLSSICNLSCGWCIGTHVGKRLPDLITLDNIDRIIGQIEPIPRVKFSGFMGEPLLKKDVLLRALDLLGNKTVGLFTNGQLMDANIRRHLLGIDYVHVSLDGGRESYGKLKGGNFVTVIDNLLRFAELRSWMGGVVKINVGYVVVPENSHEIYETTRLVKSFGVDSIRFKYDYVQDQDIVNFDRVIDDFDDDRFTVSVISKPTWNRSGGCMFWEEMTTIGSDGKLYCCDHNTVQEATPLGDLLSQDFSDIWENRKFNCISEVCPPYGSYRNRLSL